MAAVCREARLLLQSISVGAVLMMVYDLIRLFRALVRHPALSADADPPWESGGGS